MMMILPLFLWITYTSHLSQVKSGGYSTRYQFATSSCLFHAVNYNYSLPERIHSECFFINLLPIDFFFKLNHSLLRFSGIKCFLQNRFVYYVCMYITIILTVVRVLLVRQTLTNKIYIGIRRLYIYGKSKGSSSSDWQT